MALWTHYNPDDFKDNSYELIPEGNYRVRIDKVEETVTHSSNKDMLKLTLSVSGYNSKLWGYIVLDDTNEETILRTNRYLNSVFSSFGITSHTMDTREWEGKTGGVKVRHKDDAQGVKRAEVAFFLYAREVDKLPAWQEGKNGTVSTSNINPDMVNVSDNGNPNPFGIPF